MNLLILDSGHAKDTKGKNNASQGFYEWEFNNDMQYKIKSRCEELGIKVFLTNPNPNKVSDINLTTRASLANTSLEANNFALTSLEYCSSCFHISLSSLLSCIICSF